MSCSHDFLVYNDDEKMPISSTNTEDVRIPESIVGLCSLEPKNMSPTDLKALGEALERESKDENSDTTENICSAIRAILNHGDDPNNTLYLDLIDFCNKYLTQWRFNNKPTIKETVSQIKKLAAALVHNFSASAPAAPRLFPPRNTFSTPNTTEQKLNDFIREYLINPLEKGSTLQEIKDSLRHNFQYLRQLKDEGFTAGELRKAGFSAWELSAAGFYLYQLKNAGFSPR